MKQQYETKYIPGTKEVLDSNLNFLGRTHQIISVAPVREYLWFVTLKRL